MELPHSPSTFKIFLVCCNIGLLFVGLALLIMGIKMQEAFSLIMLIHVPFVADVIKAVIAVGILLSTAAVAGIGGSCYEMLSLIIVHLCSLGLMVVIEFAIGVALFFVRSQVAGVIESQECNQNCAANLDMMVLDYALPSAGIMMTIIFVESFMIYCAVRLILHLRENPKIEERTFTVNRSHSMAYPSPRIGFPMEHMSPYEPQLDYMNLHPRVPQYMISSPSPHCTYEQCPPSYMEATTPNNIHNRSSQRNGLLFSSSTPLLNAIDAASSTSGLLPVINTSPQRNIRNETFNVSPQRNTEYEISDASPQRNPRDEIFNASQRNTEDEIFDASPHVLNQISDASPRRSPNPVSETLQSRSPRNSVSRLV